MNQIRISNSIAIDYVQLPDTLKQKIVQELTLDNPEYSRIPHLGKPISNISQYQTLYQVTTDEGTRRKWLILPRGFLPTLIQLCREAELPFQLIDRRLTREEVAFDSQIVLHEYQKVACSKALAAKSGLIQAPCGSGKTMIGLEIIAQAGQPALWLVHTKDLMEQSVERIQKYLQVPVSEIGIIGDGRHTVGERITVGMGQNIENRINPELVNSFGLVILDEAHHAPVKTFSSVINAFPALYRLGLTAMPYRRDGMHPLMYYAIGYTIHKIAEADIVESGELMLPTVKLMATRFFFRYRNNYTKLIKALTANNTRNTLIIQHVAEEALAGHYCLVLSERIAHCELLHQKLAQIAPEVKAATLVGELDHSERQNMLDALKNRELNVVFADHLANGGLDIPHLDRLFLATPYRSVHKAKQQIELIMRSAEGKSDAIIYDFMDRRVPVLRTQVELRKDIYDSFRNLESVEMPLDVETIENLYTKDEPASTVKQKTEEKQRKWERKKSKKPVRRERRVTCDGCGKQTIVPFAPDSRRPTYCNECFEARKSTTLGHALQQAFSQQRPQRSSRRRRQR